MEGTEQEEETSRIISEISCSTYPMAVLVSLEVPERE